MIVCITVPKQHDRYSVHLKGIEDLHHTLEVCLDLDLSRHLGGLASLYRLFTRDVKSPCPLKYRHRYLRANFKVLNSLFTQVNLIECRV